MADGLEFDPAMFGMKANHGMLRPDKANSKPTASQQPFHPGTGSNSTTLNSAEGGGQSVRGDRGAFQRGGNRGGRGNSHRGRGGNRGGRGGQNHRTNEGQPFKRQRFDNDAQGRGSRGFFKPSMLEDPWSHLS